MTLKQKLKSCRMNNKDFKDTKISDRAGTSRYGLINMVECAVFASVLCLLSPIAVFVGPIPVTLQMFAVLFVAVVLGAKKAVVTVGVYVLLGCFGLPVFSGAKAGAAVLLGPTGGYIMACIPAAFIMGLLCNIKLKNKKRELAAGIAAGLLVVSLCYAGGTLWYVYVSKVQTGTTGVRVSVYSV